MKLSDIKLTYNDRLVDKDEVINPMILPLIDTLRFMVLEDVPERIDNTWLSVNLLVSLEQDPYMSEFPAVAVCTTIRMVRSLEDKVYFTAVNTHENSISFNMVFDSMAYDWSLHKFHEHSKPYVERSYLQKLHECISVAIKYAKTGEVKLKEELLWK